MINGIKAYEIVFMFVIFAVLGYLAEQCFCIALGKVAKRGILAGPYGFVYGLGAAIATIILGPVPEQEDYTYITSFIAGFSEGTHKVLFPVAVAAACFVLYYGLLFGLKLISGKRFYSLWPVYPIIATLCAMAAILQLRPVVMLLASGLPAVLVILITVVIAGGMFSNAVDAIPALVEYHDDSKKESPWVQVAEAGQDDTQEDAPGPFDHLKTEGPQEPSAEERIISRWERAYPHLRNKR